MATAGLELVPGSSRLDSCREKVRGLWQFEIRAAHTDILMLVA